MKLTKDGQRVYDQLKADGVLDEEMVDMLFPYERTEEEEKEDVRMLTECRNAYYDNMTPNGYKDHKQRMEELRLKFLKEDEENAKNG